MLDLQTGHLAQPAHFELRISHASAQNALARSNLDISFELFLLLINQYRS